MLAKTDKFPSVIVRPFLVYGPHQSKNRLIPQVIQGCLNDSEFPVSSGKQLRDFCYIDDFIEGNINCYEAKYIGEHENYKYYDFNGLEKHLVGVKQK